MRGGVHRVSPFLHRRDETPKEPHLDIWNVGRGELNIHQPTSPLILFDRVLAGFNEVLFSHELKVNRDLSKQWKRLQVLST